ncbi:hypothetical protein AAKU55_001345 [Oxalobacteraceae bacterium GrIS 1.11]
MFFLKLKTPHGSPFGSPSGIPYSPAATSLPIPARSPVKATA